MIIVDSLLENEYIQRRTKIFVCADYQNLIHAITEFLNSRAQRWRFILEDHERASIPIAFEKKELVGMLLRISVDNTNNKNNMKEIFKMHNPYKEEILVSVR